MHSMSKISAALGGQFEESHPIRRELAKAIKLVESGESVRGDDNANTVDCLARIIDGLSRQVLDLGAAFQEKATIARTNMHMLEERANMTSEAAGASEPDNNENSRPEDAIDLLTNLISTPHKRTEPANTPPSGTKVEPKASPVTMTGQAIVEPSPVQADNRPANANRAYGPFPWPGHHGPISGPWISLDSGRRSDVTPAASVAAEAMAVGAAIFCHEQTQWSLIESGNCDPLVLIVHKSGGDWGLPWTQVDPKDQGEYGAVARAYHTQSNLLLDDLEIAKSARIRPLRNGIRYHTAVYTKPISSIYGFVNRREWGVPSVPPLCLKAQWIKKSTLMQRQTIHVGLLTIVDQCWGAVLEDFELHKRASTKTKEALSNIVPNRMPEPTLGQSVAIATAAAAAALARPPAVVDLVQEGNELDEGQGEASDRVNPSPRGSILGAKRRVQDPPIGSSPAKIPKAGREQPGGSAREPAWTAEAPPPAPSTFYTGGSRKRPASPDSDQGRATRAALKVKASGPPPQESPSGSRPVVPPLPLYGVGPTTGDPLDLRRPPNRPVTMVPIMPEPLHRPADTTAQNRRPIMRAMPEGGYNEGIARAMRAHNGEIKVREVQMVDAATVIPQGGECDADMCCAARINLLTTRAIQTPADPWADPQYRTLCKPWNSDGGCLTYKCSDLHACDAIVPIMPQAVMDLALGDRMTKPVPIMYAPCGSLSHRRQDHMRFQDALMRPRRRAYEGELWWVMGRPPKVFHANRWAGIADPPNPNGATGSHGGASDHGDLND